MADQHKIDTELQGWISGGIVSDRVIDQYGTRVVVTQEGDLYTILRGFSLGEGAGVSVDLQDATPRETIEHLLAHYAL